MNEDAKAAMVEQELLKTQFPLECEEIPLESLNPTERKVVIKCMDRMDLTDEEFTLLKATLEKYRGAITKYRPTETIEAIEKTENMILTESDWLNIVNDKSNRMLNVNVPYNSQWYPMEFEILPLDDSRVVTTLQTHIELFKDYSKEEMRIWSKAQQGQTISPEEKQIVDRMTKEIEDKNSEDRISSMNNFLAAQLRLPNSTSDFNVRLEFWEKFPFITKAAIMAKVEDRLGLTDQDSEKLFPTS
jgi:hypothetical protein